MLILFIWTNQTAHILRSKFDLPSTTCLVFIYLLTLNHRSEIQQTISYASHVASVQLISLAAGFIWPEPLKNSRQIFAFD